MGIRTKLGLKEPESVGVAPFVQRAPRQQVPKLLHFIWVGDETKRPDGCIDTWRRNHPDYDVKVWGNREYSDLHWRLKRHMDVSWTRELCGVADLMRFEILANEGGVALDADSLSLRRLPRWILDCEAFAARSDPFGLRVSVGVMGSKPDNPFFHKLVDWFDAKADVFDRLAFGLFRRPVRAWKASGPVPFTEAITRERYTGMTILPTHFFYPQLMRGKLVYEGGGPVYAHQLWGSTFGYDAVYREARRYGAGSVDGPTNR